MIKTAVELSELIATGIENLNILSGRKKTRFQMSIKGVSKMSGKPVIDKIFLDNLGSEMTNHGWVMFQNGNTTLAFIQLETTMTFKKISCKMLLNGES